MNLTDTDRINIYSYRGTDFTGDLHDYLAAQGLDIRTVEAMDGYITVMSEEAQYNFPQYVQWGSMANKIKAEEANGES